MKRLPRRESLSHVKNGSVAAIAATYTKQASDIFLPEAESPATFKDAYLLLSNRVDKPKDVAIAYAKRWRIEVFTVWLSRISG